MLKKMLATLAVAIAALGAVAGLAGPVEAAPYHLDWWAAIAYNGHEWTADNGSEPEA